MANPTSVSGSPACILTDNAVAVSLAIDAARQYMLSHDGEDAGGNAHTDTVFCAVGTATAAVTEGAGKFKLPAGRTLLVGPGQTILSLLSAAKDPTVSILPLEYKPGNF